jgi:hypothetical protein
VLAGVDTTEEPVELLSVADGLHVYVFAPPAVSVVDCPAQIVAGDMDTTGWAVIVTVTCAVAVHPRASPVTVYVVVVSGFAVTVEPVVALNAVAGDQAYVLAPFAVKVVFWPVHKVRLGVTVTAGTGLTVTVTCAVAVQPSASPVTVYVVVAIGLAVTLEPVVALRAVDGVHEYVLAPPAVKVVDCPAQYVTFGETVTTGTGLTVTVI